MKHVVITGAGKGIGKALAEKFLSEGFAVTGTYHESDAYRLPSLTLHPLDLTKPHSIDSFVSALTSVGQKIDILINNAGVLLDDEDIVLDEQKLRGTLEVNLIGTTTLTEKLLPLLSNGGHIVNISSQAGSLADIENFVHSHAPLRYPAYKISKAALNMYTRTLALRLQERGITVSSVHPGWVRTDMGGEEAPILPEEAAKDIFEFAVSKPLTGGFWFKGRTFPW